MCDLTLTVEQSHSLKLLYVEDEFIIRESMQVFLEELFTDITIAVDGKDGVKKFKENDIDLVIADINMPNMGGFEMIKQIKELNKDVSTVILSAHHESHYFNKSMELDVDGYMLKPFNMEKFFDILNNIHLKLEVRKLNIRPKLTLLGSKVSTLSWHSVA